jgi:Cu(I)/Ag(I) efflux system membrane fusion protein/cobalt-zinc-cadmium efflux system membrane fusion protein
MKRALTFVVIFIAILAAGLIVYRVRALQSSMSTMPTGVPTTSAVAPTPTPRGDVVVDPRRQQLIGVRMVTAGRSEMTPTIRAAGTVQYAETRQSEINLKLDGWIRELFVDYTGQPITKGQPIFTLYSPDLLATENEYLLAVKTREQLQGSQIPDARERADQLVVSARRRLTLWDLPESELRSLDNEHQAHDVVTFYSPVTGIVMEKTAVRGMHLTAGQTLYKIADLSTVWVEADVYERELPLIKIGDRATVTLDAYPDERFEGRAVYIYPYVNDKTRTNKVRYEFANRSGRLKPGMFANVEIAVPAGMALTLPTDAVLDSGTEQLVFVAKGDGYFEPRHVKVGRRFGDQIQIVGGLKEGEQVAAGATFFLDSESQLRSSLQGYEPPAGSAAPSPTAAQLDIGVRTVPDPPTTGENQFEVSVKDAAGKPVDGADVALQFFMPAMPTMNMPAMRNEIKLPPAGNGMYRGPGVVLMSGRWETTVVVTRNGQRLGTRQLPMVTK